MTRPEAPSPAAAIGLVAAAGVFFIVGGLPLQILLGEAGIVAAQITFLLLPALLFLRLGGYSLTRVLSLRIPTRQEVLGGAVFFLGGLQLAWFIAWIQGSFIEVPVAYLDAMAEMLRADSAGRLVWLLFLAAVVPSLTEEVLFRGVLLSGLRSRLTDISAVLISGIVFGLFHLTPETMFRLLPSAWLGVLLGWVVVSTGSLPLAALLHFCNNALILLITAIPAADARMNDPDGMPPLAFLPLAVILFWWGALRLRRAFRVRMGSGISAPTHDGSTPPGRG